jgi:ATP:ADP antiporter, AAA family
LCGRAYDKYLRRSFDGKSDKTAPQVWSNVGIIRQMKTWLLRVTGATSGELAASLWSFLYFFCLLAGYYILRPIRDEMAVQIGQKHLHELFTAVFITTLAIIPIFGWLNKTFPRRTLLPWLYVFFIVQLLGLYLWMQTPSDIMARSFFVWVLVFNLFAVSVFWSFMADLFSTDQAKRLYGFIAAGGTAGGLAGPSLTALFVNMLGTRTLLLIAAAFFAVCVFAIFQLRTLAREREGLKTDAQEKLERPVSIWSGLIDIARSPYLLGICAFLFLYSLLSTALYFQQTELLPKAISDSKERVKMLAQVDLAVNVLTLFIQLFAFGALIKKLGVTVMLVALPILSFVGFGALALAPTLTTLVIFGVMRRAGEYAVSKPARETLYNVLPPAQKYTAKNIIDTAVHRGGDTLASWLFKSLQSAGLGLTAMAWIAVPIAAVWGACSYALGREAQRRQALEK